MFRSLAAAVLLTGCAHASFRPSVEPLGDYRATAGLRADAEDYARSELSAVRVSIGKVPSGITLDGDRIEADPARYEVLAEVTSEPDFSAIVLGDLDLGFYSYPDRFHAAWCNAQVPLGWVTLGIWTVVPTHYPCVVQEGRSDAAIDRRRGALIEALVRATLAAGGNLLVVTSIGDLSIVDALTGREIGRTPTIAASGFALRDKADATQ